MAESQVLVQKISLHLSQPTLEQGHQATALQPQLPVIDARRSQLQALHALDQYMSPASRKLRPRPARQNPCGRPVSSRSALQWGWRRGVAVAALHSAPTSTPIDSGPAAIVGLLEALPPPAQPQDQEPVLSAPIQSSSRSSTLPEPKWLQQLKMDGQTRKPEVACGWFGAQILVQTA